MAKIDIKEFAGLFTDGDNEDLPKTYLIEMTNFRSINGKLEKTMGLGDTGESAITAAPGDNYVFRNLTTYIHTSLSGGSNYLSLQIGGASRHVVMETNSPALKN